MRNYILLAVGMLLVPVGAFAQPQPQYGQSVPNQQQELKKEALMTCEPDIKRLCGRVEPGEGRIKACMMQHAQSVSPQCKQAILFEKAESR
jgi:hypothetical protein